MAINDIVTNIYKAKFAIVDDFEFIFLNNTTKFTGIQGFTPEEVWKMCCINIDNPQLASGVGLSLHGGVWRQIAQRNETYTFSVNFRDFEGLELRKYFIKVWEKQQKGYYDDIVSHVQIKIDKQMIFESSKVLISNISQVQFDNNNTQIAEFTISFASPVQGAKI